jgi:hypothetical protein
MGARNRRLITLVLVVLLVAVLVGSALSSI